MSAANCGAGKPHCILEAVVDLILLIIVLFLVFGGGGYWGYRRWR